MMNLDKLAELEALCEKYKGNTFRVFDGYKLYERTALRFESIEGPNEGILGYLFHDEESCDEKCIGVYIVKCLDLAPDLIFEVKRQRDVIEKLREALAYYSDAMPCDEILHVVFRDKQRLESSTVFPKEPVYINGVVAREALKETSE
jgi:hypothetical protein